MAKTEKIYKIEKTHKGRTKIIEGTLQELTKYFSYTLECGNSWNKKINETPKTIASLIKNLEMSVQETQGGCFEQDYYKLMEESTMKTTITLKTAEEVREAYRTSSQAGETACKTAKAVKAALGITTQKELNDYVAAGLLVKTDGNSYRLPKDTATEEPKKSYSLQEFETIKTANGREAAIQYLTGHGISWKQDVNASVNWMRAVMAAKKA